MHVHGLDADAARTGHAGQIHAVTPEHARAAAELADGVVVGSRAVQVAEDGPEALREYVASLREAL